MVKKIVIYVGVMCVLCTVSYSSETVQKKIERLQENIVSKEYKNALRAVDAIRGEIYDLLTSEKEPEVKGNTYRNHYFQFQISNPVAEWKMRKIVIPDEIFIKRKRLVKDLVRIDNSMSPYGLIEHLMVSVYDVGASPYKAQIESLEFRPQYFLKQIAEKIYKQQLVGDAKLTEKESSEFRGNPAYRILFTLDTGKGMNITMFHYFVYVREQQAIFTFSFIMQTENYAIYKYIFEEILSGVRFSKKYQDDVAVVQRSFMDIYLERQGN